MNQVVKFRLVKLIMAFAMFWLFMGDLIILHQSRIFGKDFYGQYHLPINKSGKSDDGKTFQKQHKSGDKGDNGSFLDLSIGDVFQGLTPIMGEELIYPVLHQYFKTCRYTVGTGLRAPPAIG